MGFSQGACYADLASQRMDFDGVEVTVVTPRMLFLMKRDTIRPKDRADASLLARRFRLQENE